MGSPTQGMWTCRHGVDGRDWCPECYQTAEEEAAEGPRGDSVLDRETSRLRVLREQCSTCVGRPGNLMYLRPGRLKLLIEENTGPNALGLICHQTLRYGDHPDFGCAICRWFYDGYGHLANGIRVLRRLIGIIEVDPPEED